MDHTLGSKEIKSGNVKEMYIEEEARPRQSVSNIILPGTSFYPPATEIDRITEEIKAGIDALAELDAKLEEMHRQRETLIADISQKKSAISKIRLIPVEVFSIIFIFYIAMTDSTFEPSDEADNNSSTTESSLTLPSPWVLMQVCRQWRLAAMHTSSLWSCIRLCTADIAGQRYFSGYEHCHSTAMLRNALARTKGGPIEMIWSFGRFDCSISQQNFWASPQETIDVLRDTGAHLQIRVLGFEKPSPEIIDEVNEIDFVDFQLPTLEELVLCWSSPGLDERIQKTAHRLQYLSFQSTYKRQSDWNLSKMASRLTLELQDHQGFNKPPDPGWALMLSSGVNLVNLTLHDIQIGLSGAQLISIPTLEELDLIKTRFNCKVDFPNLRALSLRSSDFLAHISKPLVLPLLKSLEAHLPNPHDCPLIQAQSLQSLEILSLPTQWSNRTTLEKLFEKVIETGYLATRLISLYPPSPNLDRLANILDRIPHLMEIHIKCRSHLGKPFLEALAGCSFGSDTSSTIGKPICPSLQCLRFDLSEINGSITKSSVSEWLCKAVEERSKGQYPIKEAFLREEWGGPWISLL